MAKFHGLDDSDPDFCGNVTCLTLTLARPLFIPPQLGLNLRYQLASQTGHAFANEWTVYDDYGRPEDGESGFTTVLVFIGTEAVKTVTEALTV
jgi:hypothetical protein